MDSSSPLGCHNAPSELMGKRGIHVITLGQFEVFEFDVSLLSGKRADYEVAHHFNFVFVIFSRHTLLAIYRIMVKLSRHSVRQKRKGMLAN